MLILQQQKYKWPVHNIMLCADGVTARRSGPPSTFRRDTLLPGASGVRLHQQPYLYSHGGSKTFANG